MTAGLSKPMQAHAGVGRLAYQALKDYCRMWTLSKIQGFRLLEDPGGSGMDLHVQKRGFQPISDEPDRRLSAELPLSIENHQFSVKF